MMETIEPLEDYVYEEEAPMVANTSDAEDAFRHLHYWMEQERQVKVHAKAEIDKISLWEDLRLIKIAKKRAWHEHALRAYMESTRSKKLELVHGKVSIVMGRESVQIEDPDTFKSWAVKEGYLNLLNEKTTTTPDKKAIMAHFKDTGEVMESVTIERGPDKLTVKLNEHVVEATPITGSIESGEPAFD